MRKLARRPGGIWLCHEQRSRATPALAWSQRKALVGQDSTYGGSPIGATEIRKADDLTGQRLLSFRAVLAADERAGIFGAASAYRSARQLGHSVAVAEKHYLGLVKVQPEAKTLEQAMAFLCVS